jgi:hypothetical protein
MESFAVTAVGVRRYCESPWYPFAFMKIDRSISSDKDDEDDEDETLAEFAAEECPDGFIGGVFENDAAG